MTVASFSMQHQAQGGGRLPAPASELHELVRQGPPGAQGPAGSGGGGSTIDDAATVSNKTWSSQKIAGEIAAVELTPGPQGPAGPTGADGATGATGATGPAGPGLPTGGAVGQFARKASATDFDTAWMTMAPWITSTTDPDTPTAQPRPYVWVQVDGSGNTQQAYLRT